MPDKKIKVFISYSHKDEDIKSELDAHLIGLKRSDKIEVWQDRALIGGDEWNETIIEELKTADLIILLISINFLNSKYIWEKEVAIAMERHKNKTARVIPIIAKSCDFTDFSFAALQALPKNAAPINSFSGGERDLVYTEIAKSIKAVVNFMTGNV
jgi:TIR domain